jgi:hypothetical protein
LFGLEFFHSFLWNTGHVTELLVISDTRP